MIDSIEWARVLWLWLLPLALASGMISYKLRSLSVLPLAPLQFNKQYSSASLVFILLSILESIVVISLIIGIAGPQKSIRQKLLKEPGADIALVLDISASMMADDFKPNRLEELKKQTVDFIQNAGNNRYGLYVFAGSVFTHSTFTTDQNALKEMISYISYEMINHGSSGGTAIGTALLYAHDNLIAYREEGRDQAILLITDGENSSGLDPEIAARAIADSKIRLYIIGMAGTEPVPLYVYGEKFINSNDMHVITSLDDESLKKITEIADGKYYRATDGNVMRGILKDISKLEKTPLEINTQISIVSYSPYVAIFALLILAIWGLIYFFYRRPLQ